MAVLLAACGGAAAEPTAFPALTATQTVESPAAERGARLYAENCSTCHGDRDGKGGIPEAPRHNDTGHTWHHPDAQLRDWVLNGKIGFSQMPPQKDKLSAAQVDLILAFLKTWWTPEQRAFQEDVSKRYQESLDRLKK
ncbi:MAG: cytochrome c [Chloroflexi bacterium]|nr:cytochrome c [Chloroflexota bacterium]